MSAVTGAATPAPANIPEIATTRSLQLPSGSPSGKRSAGVTTWRTTPGDSTSAPLWATEPMTRWAAMASAIRPPGSTDSSRRPASAPPWAWKYHHGMPFCSATTGVRVSNRAASRGATSAIWCDFSASTTKSCVPSTARLSALSART
jgi:hypothetical protein